MPPLDPALDRVVERHWQAALGRWPLFNGRVFCADRIETDRIEGHWTEYRRETAQIADPTLFPDLGIRSLAVCGVISGPDGVVIGRREPRSFYQAGLWQCPPAGSVDHGAACEGGADWRAALLTELHEEVGMTADHVMALRPLCLMQHPSGVLDLGIEILTGLKAAAIRAAHARAAHAEYDRLLIAPAATILDRIRAEGGDAVPAVAAFLSRLQP